VAETPSIRFITRKWEPAMGGMETYCVRLTQEMTKTHRLDIIALPGKPDGAVPSPLALLWFGIKTALRLLFVRKSDIVHGGDMAIWPLLWIARLRHPSSKIILSAHGSDLNFATGMGVLAKAYAAYLWLATKMLSDAKIIANSRWIAELAGTIGFRSVITVPLATDIRAERAPTNHHGTLLFAGRIMTGKGLHFLTDKVLPLIPNPPRLSVAGTIWDEEEAKALQSPLVDYLGRLDPATLAQAYGEALAVLVPSQIREGFGLVAIEAAACGGVVIASNHSGLAEAVGEDIGFLADSKDPQAWADRIIAIRDWSTQQRHQFVGAAMQTAHHRYSWDRVARDTLAAYTA
jgi:glycosyltransferase involved in cell wall biosynthesis